MKIDSIKNIDIHCVISLISQIYKNKNNTSLLNTIPFLVSIANFWFHKGFLTDLQQRAVFSVYERYKTEQKLKKETSNS